MTGRLDFPCPHCARRLTAPLAARGRAVACPHCHGRTTAPDTHRQARRRMWVAVGAVAAAVVLGVATAGVAVAVTRRPAAPPEATELPAPPKADRVARPAPKSPAAEPAPSEELPARLPVSTAAQDKAPAPPKGRRQAAAPAAPALGVARAAEQVKPAVARIEGRTGHGSGFLVGPDVVATNAHVVLTDLATDLTVRFTTDGLPDAAGYKAKLLHVDKVRDLALLRLDRAPPGREPVRLAAATGAAAGAPLAVVGNPVQAAGPALANAVAVGRWEADTVVHNDRPYYRASLPPGDADVKVGRGVAGAPAVDDRGEVVGVLTRADFDADRRPTGRVYLLPARDVRAALDGLGPRAGWDAAAVKAGARHALDIAAVNLLGHAMTAGTHMDTRVALARNPPPNWVQADRMVVTQYRNLGKQFEAALAPVLRAARVEGGLTDDQRAALADMQSGVERVKGVVVMDWFRTAKHKWALDGERRTNRAGDRVRTESGVTGELYRAMLDALEAELDGAVELDDQEPLRLRQ